MDSKGIHSFDKAEVKEFFHGILVMGIPVMIQSLINSLVNMLDVFMVGQLGEVAITASSLGNSWFFLFALLVGGITAAGSIFIAQYWGSGSREQIHKYMGIMFLGVGILMAVFGLLSILGSDHIIRIYSRDPRVIECGSSYIRIIGFSYFLFPITNVYVTALRSTENTRIPMFATIISLVCNLTLNFILIFGHFGLPAMGVLGAAVATLIARTIEFLFIIGYVYIRKSPVAAGMAGYFSFTGVTVREYIKYGFFVILGEAIYAFGTSVYNIAYKYTGTESQAALQIVNSLNNLAMVLSIGIGQSAGIVIGKMLGKNEFDKAKRFCKMYLLFVPIFSIFASFIIVLWAPVFTDLFKIGPQARSYVDKMVWILACQLPFKAVNFTIVTGILRSGGDSGYCFFSNFCGTWIFGIPLAMLGAIVWKLPVYYVYLLISADELSKFFICFPRAIRFKWLHNLTISQEKVNSK